MPDHQHIKFKEVLDLTYKWPSEYTFKFIAPKGSLALLEAMFSTCEIKIRDSKNGNYSSVTATILLHSSDDVIAIYEQASKIPGLIAL